MTAENGQGGADMMNDAKAQGASLLEGLMDLSFTQFITTKVIKVLYVLGILGSLLFGLMMVLGSLAGGPLAVLMALILAPIMIVIQIIALRVGLELTVVMFGIADGVKKIADRG